MKWAAIKNDHGSLWHVTDEDGYWIADELNEEAAKLIAAAPDLRAKLANLAHMVDELADGLDSPTDEQFAEAAIAAVNLVYSTYPETKPEPTILADGSEVSKPVRVTFRIIPHYSVVPPVLGEGVE